MPNAVLSIQAYA